MAEVQESVEVASDAQRIYEMWSEMEHYADFIPHVLEVRRTGETLSHWTMERNGQRYECDVQTVQMLPEQCIALQTTDAPSPVTGTVHLDPTADGTKITLTVETDGYLDGEVAETIREALRRFKEIADQGPPHRWPTASAV